MEDKQKKENVHFYFDMAVDGAIVLGLVAMILYKLYRSSKNPSQNLEDIQEEIDGIEKVATKRAHTMATTARDTSFSSRVERS